MTDNSNGRKWARFWLVTALVVSVVANVTHTVLADSAISLWLRVPGAVVWPVFTFAGIEILARVIWQRRATHSFARAVLLAAAVPAAITSYEHQYNLLGLMGEGPVIQVIGPLAIDGLMIGCTLTLLFTRTATAPVQELPQQLLEQPTEISDADAEELLERWSAQLATPATTWQPGDPITHPLVREIPEEERVYTPVTFSAPISPAPAGNGQRQARASSADKRKAVELMLDGRASEAVEQGLMGRSTLDRYRKYWRDLQDGATYDSADIKARRLDGQLAGLVWARVNGERRP